MEVYAACLTLAWIPSVAALAFQMGPELDAFHVKELPRIAVLCCLKQNAGECARCIADVTCISSLSLIAAHSRFPFPPQRLSLNADLIHALG